MTGPESTHIAFENTSVIDSNFQCFSCERKFTRKEHLLRHERIHTKETPFCCTVCGSRFHRQDVLRRHLRTSCNNAREARRRSFRACISCRAQKLKCDGDMPCERCFSKSIQCVYSQARQIPPEIRTPSPVPNVGKMCRPPESQMLCSTLPPSIPAPVACDTFHTSRPTVAPLSLITSTDSEVASSNISASSLLQMSSSAALTAASKFIGGNGTPEATSYPPSHFFGLDTSDFDVSIFPGLDDFYDSTISQASLDCFDPNMLMSLSHFESNLPDSLEEDTLAAYLSQRESQSQDTLTPRDLPTWHRNITPTIQSHDPEVINYFLNNFMASIPPSLPTFQSFTPLTDVTPELLLGMAAVGGLFCDVPGSFRLALALYNDTRRLAIGRAWSDDMLPAGQAFNLAQTFICIELFGFYSGDARCFECSEALHTYVIQIVEQNSLLKMEETLSEEDLQDRLRLMISLSVLETMYVITIQRPATLYPFTMLSNLSESVLYNKPVVMGLIRSFYSDLVAAMNPHRPLATHSSALSVTFTLSTLATMSWHVNTRRKSEYGPSMASSQQMLELSLYRWVGSTSCAEETDVSSLILFHMTFISIHTDLHLIHKLARMAFCRDNYNEAQEEIRCWSEANDGDISISHARELIQIAKRISVFRVQTRSGTTTPTPATNPTLSTTNAAEIAHLPIAVHIATLVLWASTIAQRDSYSNASHTHLESGMHILSCLKIRIAAKLKNVLRSLSASCRGRTWQKPIED